jgi:hypothetical protein
MKRFEEAYKAEMESSYGGPKAKKWGIDSKKY